jgi:serine/threonine protein kinase
MLTGLTPLAEPVPGYKLLEPIGRGGFGEVWKAEAPGGVLKAIKLIFGTLRSGTGDDVPVLQELKSLDAIKKVRHPYILSLDRYDLVDGQLIVIMELADCNLWDRYQGCRGRGQPGIPRNELLRYLTEAAEALDLMNLQLHLQHSDIKPQNLFLVHRHVKVADFGLVKDLEGLRTAGHFCISPLYAAPETFDGGVSSTSDQYSLAIVYQELLTGRRPFEGSNPRQLLFQHLQKPPDLSLLSPADQKVLRRALAKKPAERFASCGDMVRALRGLPARPTAVQQSAPMNPNVVPVAAACTDDLSNARVAAAGYTMERGTCQVRCPGCGFTGCLPNRFKGLRIKCRACHVPFTADATHLILAASAAAVDARTAKAPVCPETRTSAEVTRTDAPRLPKELPRAPRADFVQE